MPESCRFTDRELATLLADVRRWQTAQEYGEDLAPYAGHFAEDQPLSSSEIDELCERINRA